MTRVVYIDVLFAVNLITNYFILLAVSIIFHRVDKRWRLLLGAAFGALYSLLIFVPSLSFLYSVILKLVFSIIIVVISFHFSSFISLVKLVIGFYITSFLFGGIVFAVYLFASPPGLYINNGVLYFDISPLMLIGTSAGCYIVITLVSRLLHRKNHEDSIYDLTVYLGSLSCNAKALMDTGNSLCDQITGAPVIIVEYQTVEKLIPKSMRSSFKNGTIDPNGGFKPTEWPGRLRVIPYNTVSGANNLLPAFKPDRVKAHAGKVILDTTNVLIAVNNKKLSEDGSYTALLNAVMLDEVRAD